MLLAATWAAVTSQVWQICAIYTTLSNPEQATERCFGFIKLAVVSACETTVKEKKPHHAVFLSQNVGCIEQRSGSSACDVAKVPIEMYI